MRVRRSMIGARIALAALAASMALVARGQGFNIDIEDPFSPPPLGGGVPADSFGGAAGTAGLGYWNAVPDTGTAPMVLTDVSGSLTNVICTMPQGGVGGGNNFSGNTGDYAKLLNDFRLVSDGDTWRVDGLQAGAYDVYVYAVYPSDGIYETEITVSADSGSSTRSVTGPMPGNAFILGQTHQVFSVAVTTGPLSITTNYGPTNFGCINGFQIVPVPEPASLISVAGGLALLVLRRRYKRGAA